MSVTGDERKSAGVCAKFMATLHCVRVMLNLQFHMRCANKSEHFAYLEGPCLVSSLMGCHTGWMLHAPVALLHGEVRSWRVQCGVDLSLHPLTYMHGVPAP